MLLKVAKRTVPRVEWKRTPLVLRATAGLRLLPAQKAQALLDQVRVHCLVLRPYWEAWDGNYTIQALCRVQFFIIWELFGATMSDTIVKKNKKPHNLLSNKAAGRKGKCCGRYYRDRRGSIVIREQEISVEGSCGGDKIVTDSPGAPWMINDTLLIPPKGNN